MKRFVAAFVPLVVMLGIAAPASANYPDRTSAFNMSFHSSYDSCDARSSWCKSISYGKELLYGDHSRYFEWYLNNANGQHRCVVMLWIGHSYLIWDKQVRDYSNRNYACVG